MADEPARVLLVDDEPAVLAACGETLVQAGYAVTAVASGREALAAFAREPFDVAVLDLVLPDVDGLSILGALREADPEVVVILMTGHASLEAAIEAVRRGAYDFLRKPFSTLDLARVVARGLERRRLAVQNRELVADLDRANQDLRQQVGAVTEELTAFLNLGRRLGGATGPLPLVHEMLRAALQVTTAASGAVWRVLPPARPGEGMRSRCLAAAGEAADDLGTIEGAAEQGLLARCLREQQPAIVSDLLADPETAAGPFALLGLRSAMALPLLAVSGVVGVMTLFDPAQPFTDRQASLVKVLVAQAAEVVAQADLRGVARTAEGGDEFVDLRDIVARRRE